MAETQHRRMRYRECPQDFEQSETPGMHGNSTRENRETPSMAAGEDAGRLEKGPKSVGGRSDGRILSAERRIVQV